MDFGDLLGIDLQGDKGVLKIQVDRDIVFKTTRYKQDKIGLTIDDSRVISTDQRRKIYATLRDMSDYTGHDPEDLKQLLKYELMARQGLDYFSFSNCSMTTANQYLNLLIKTCIDFDIPLSDRGADRTNDVDTYLYMCLKTRTCAISGKPNADIHHVDRVGLGRDRHSIDHSSLRLIALSRDWHVKVHAEGEQDIFKKYKVYGITLDRLSLEELGIQKEEIS